LTADNVDGCLLTMKIAMTIAGSDSGAGAGLQADLKTFAALGVYGTSAVTAITAQNTVGVSAVMMLPAELVTAQIEALVSDMRPDAVKTGMLGTAAIVDAVESAIESMRLPNVVIDPVMVAKSGDHLLEKDAVTAVKTRLLRRAHVVTPNRGEAEVLSGITIDSLSDAREAARRIHDLGPSAVIVKGGHFEGPVVVDLLFDGKDFLELSGARVASRNTHGTGCTFAAAIAANLALGLPLAEAAARAKHYVAGAIRNGPAIGSGHAPMNHLWQVVSGVSRQGHEG
jgi:hydroxymethylpyrimidine/phosphomethylpyrimidine kinase